MKKVAIIGAGSSGMACAYRLEQLGFEGRIDIFESKRGPLEANIHTGLIAEFINRPVKDTLVSLSEKYDLNINPASTIYHSINHGPTTVTEFFGFLGYVIFRGGHPESVTNQMIRQSKSNIHYGIKITLKDILSEYDSVVLATGNCEYVPELVNFRIDAHSAFHYAIVAEKNQEIDPTRFEAWFNTWYAPWGYAYLLPVPPKNAMAACTGVISKEHDPIKEGWERFKLEQVAGKYEILEEHHIRNFLLGRPDYQKVGKVYLTGANGGCNIPFFGFGQFKSLLSGIYAAEAIARGESYEAQMSTINNEYEKGLALFKRLHAYGDAGYDAIIRAASTRTAKNWVKPGGPEVLSWLGLLARLIDFSKESTDILTEDEEVSVVEHLDYSCTQGLADVNDLSEKRWSLER
ncbi:MAG: NAD(P)-binding protein [Firmicutes bacterium]|nr:NAD(P)-binding protein [Bacillota bacterium]